MKYTFEIKLKAVKAIKKGIVIKEPNNEISRKWRDIIRYWEKIYDIHGEEGLKRHFKKHNYEEKLSVVREVLRGNSMNQVSVRRNIAVKSISDWVKAYRQEGISGLKFVKRRVLLNMILNKTKILYLLIAILLISCSKKEGKTVNELGEIPILMYHQIVDIGDGTTSFQGNVDKDGYARSAKAFRDDLEFYYKNNYRMIRLNDYIDGIINCEEGKSPLIITFDDGANNIKIKESEGAMIIDENCALGILEEFKEKYPDFNVTATFFLHGELFHQGGQNQNVMKWVVDHGYDIGNHTIGHNNLSEGGKIFAQRKVAEMYDLLEKMIGKNYVEIVALPYGVPVAFNHHTNQSLYEFEKDGKTYITKSLIKSLYRPEKSPFHKDANAKFLERIFAIDSKNPDEGIKNIFTDLEKTKYISDGDPNTITIRRADVDRLGKTFGLKVAYIK